MLRPISFTFLLFLFSCGSFKSYSPVKTLKVDEALRAIRVVGEGRGRLSLQEQQYVFSVDALMKDNKDWLLAVTIPLHGEEIMLLPDLVQKESHSSNVESFEKRIQRELKGRFKSDQLTGKRFIQEIRGLLRFIQSSELGLTRICREDKCQMDGEMFIVRLEEKKVIVHREGQDIELVGENLTDSIFTKTNFQLKPTSSPSQKLALELFWK